MRFCLVYGAPMPRTITVPERVKNGDVVIASVSGGKDSTALMLALKEAGVEARCVFADTGWEAKETMEYLDLLREKIGPIDVCGVPGGMLARAEYRSGFPARMQRWCTRELKLEPLRKYHDAIIDKEGVETVSAVGIRAEESARRAEMVEFEFNDDWDGYIWRPLINWTTEDVIAIHHRHDIPLNPLYTKGFSRVGCWPCIFSQKEEIRTLAMVAPERIVEVAEIERKITEQRKKRNEEQPGRYTHPDATFFQTRDGINPMYIEEVVKWSQTGKHGESILNPPTGGCYRWGFCEPAVLQEKMAGDESAEDRTRRALTPDEDDDKG